MSGWLIGAMLVAVAGCCLWVGGCYLKTLLCRRRKAHQKVLMLRSVNELVCRVVGEQEAPLSLPLERAVRRGRLLAELVAQFTESVYGCDPMPIAKLMCRYGTDRALLAEVRRSHGCRRASCLLLLAQLPPLESVRREVERYLEDPVREVRFAALLVMLAAEPAEVFRRIAAFGEPLTRCEVGEILHLLRRGLLPIAYRPLIESENSNLRRLGLAIVGHFAIEEADDVLLKMVGEAWNDDLSLAALYTLGALHRPLQRRAVVAYVQRMNRESRREWMRSMAREGYSPDQVRALLDEGQRRRYVQLVATYKRSLVCG